MTKVSIRELQGDSLYSPWNGKTVNVSGIVTGVLRRGFFIQTPNKRWDELGSDAIFVYSPSWQPDAGVMAVIEGECIDYIKHDTAKPVTQLRLTNVEVSRVSPAESRIEPIELTGELLPHDNCELARVLNAMEGMLVTIRAGQTFIAPSNAHGDYVMALDSPSRDQTAVRTKDGGVLVEASNPSRWFPGFRVTNYNHARRLNLGATLSSSITGPLHYRADAYQISVSSPFNVEARYISLPKTTIKGESDAITVMTLNCFNLDSHIESEHRVKDPRRDIDDDFGEGRFHTLAQAVVLQAACPDIIALQEIQDNDGAEISDTVDASETYQKLIKLIEALSEIRYAWLDLPPTSGADGGQPGGNIRNAFLYRVDRVKPQQQSLRLLGLADACYVDSRKPLVANFTEIGTGKQLAVINVHFASKRHQASIFAPTNPGVDSKAEVRIAQAIVVHDELERIAAAGLEYYVTGDFNDTEHSATLAAVTGNKAVNLVLSLPEDQRYDYNHRGKLQVLMHGVVPRAMAETGRAEYEILHGNELIGIDPGEVTDKPSDHAYVLAKLVLVD